MFKHFKISFQTSAFTGAVFLMATSAIGPGFITQTSVFTSELLASMGYVILCSVIIDIIAQLNIWQILAGHRKKASELANEVIPGSGHILTLMICFGGLAFNIGNIAGAGMGMSILLPVSLKTGSIISAVIAMGIFASANAQKAMDVFVKILGMVMLAMTLLVVCFTAPPWTEIIYRSVVPEKLQFTAIIALVGGTVGGYISFAGAHRLLDAKNEDLLHPVQVRKQAIRGILLTACMRALLFLAVLGVVYYGFIPNNENPAASVFQKALGMKGYFVFGLVLWCASITSVVGAAYTSVSFLETLHTALKKHIKTLQIVFVVVATVVFMFWGKPVKVLVMAGVVNGFILPFALALILWSALRSKAQAVSGSRWLHISGWAVALLMLSMSVIALFREFF